MLEWLHGEVDRTRLHALLVSLVTADYQKRLDALEQLALPAEVKRQRRDPLQRWLQQWAPHNKAIGFDLIVDGTPTASAEATADALRRHWQPTFTARPCLDSAVQHWRQLIRPIGPLPMDEIAFAEFEVMLSKLHERLWRRPRWYPI